MAFAEEFPSAIPVLNLTPVPLAIAVSVIEFEAILVPAAACLKVDA